MANKERYSEKTLSSILGHGEYSTRKLPENNYDWRIVALCRLAAAAVAAELFRLIWPVTSRHQAAITHIYGDVVLAIMLNYISSSFWRLRQTIDIVWLSTWMTLVYCSMESLHTYWLEMNMFSLVMHSLQTFTLLCIVLSTIFAVDVSICSEDIVLQPDSTTSTTHAHTRHAYFDELHMPHRVSTVVEEDDMLERDPILLDSTDTYTDMTITQTPMLPDQETETRSVWSFLKGLYGATAWSTEDEVGVLTQQTPYEEEAAQIYGGSNEWQSTPDGWENTVMQEQNYAAITPENLFAAELGDNDMNTDFVEDKRASSDSSISGSDGNGPDAAEIPERLRSQVGVHSLVERNRDVLSEERTSSVSQLIELGASETRYEYLAQSDEHVGDDEQIGRPIWQDNRNDATISMADTRPNGITKYINMLRRMSHA